MILANFFKIHINQIIEFNNREGDIMKSEDNKFRKELSIEEKNKIVTEVKNVLNRDFRILGFDGSITIPDYPYYSYFGDSDKELRRYSVGIFAIWLGYWNTGCAFRFYKQSELYKYIKNLVEYKEEIQKDFPISFGYIALFLIELTENNRYSEDYRMKPYIIEIVKTDFLKTKANNIEAYTQKFNYTEFLKELKIQDYDKPF